MNPESSTAAAEVDLYDDPYSYAIDENPYPYFKRLLDLPPEHLPQMIIFMDPPQHDRLRKLVSRGFYPRAIALCREHPSTE